MFNGIISIKVRCKWTATAQDKSGRSKYVQYAESDSQQRVVLQIGDCARDYHPPQKKTNTLKKIPQTPPPPTPPHPTKRQPLRPESFLRM